MTELPESHAPLTQTAPKPPHNPDDWEWADKIARYLFRQEDGHGPVTYRIRAVCACGWQGPVRARSEDADDDATTHFAAQAAL